MKIKILIFTFFTLCTVSIYGQLQKRNLIISGTAATQLIITESETDFLILASPTVSYFFTDRLAAGGGFLLATAPGNGTNVGLNGNARFYISSQRQGAWFLNAGAGFVTGGGFSLFNANAGIGVDLFLTPNFALESTMSIGIQKEGEVIGNTTQFLLGTGLKFFFNRFPEEVIEDRNAILRKGTTLLGVTSGSIQVLSRNNDQSSTVNLSPDIGKFINDNWVVGGKLRLQNQNVGSIDFNSFQLEVAPFARFYINPEDKRAVPFGEFGGGIQLTHLSGEFFQNNTNTNPVLFLGVGLDYFISPTVAFEIKGAYRYTKQSGLFNNNTIGIELGFQFFLDKN